MDCLESTCNRKGWSEMVVISWKIKLEKVKDWSPCFNSQDSHPPFNSCAAVRAILKSANLITHAHACVCACTHTHTHTQSSLRKNCKLLSKANESLYNLTLTYFFHELFHPLPNLCCPWKTSEAGTLHLLFPQSITLSYLLFTWLTSTHPSVLISYFYLSWEDFHDCLPAPAYETELGALLMFCHHHSIYHTAL